MDPIKVAFFSHSEPISPLEYLRVVGPISNTDFVLFSGSDLLHNIAHYVKESDLVVIQRIFPADFNTFLQILELTREFEKPLVYDLDDNLFILPENHPDRKTFVISNALLPMLYALLNVDYVTVSNDYLKNSFIDLNDNIYVLPNFLDDTLWKIMPPKKADGKKPLTIGYMGSDTHKPDLVSIKSSLLDIKNEFNEDVRFLFYGVRPPDEFLSLPDTIWSPTKTNVYSEFVEDFQKVNVDIFIAPLVDNEFNHCKSHIKFLEYSSLGVPGVFSKIPPYTNIIKDGENGFLAGDLDEWKNKIHILLNDPELRQKIAENAQMHLVENYLMSGHSELWKNTYQDIFTQGKSKNDSTSVLKNFIEAITPQVNENQKSMAGENSKLRTQLSAIGLNLQNLQSEILKYQNEINAQENKIASLSKELSSLQNKILLRDEKIADYEDIISSLRNEITSLQNEITTIRNEELKLKSVNIDRDRKINELNIEINHLKEEVLFYALSRSWRFTRPLRKIMKKIRALRK